MHNPRWTAGGFHVLQGMASGAEQTELVRLVAEIIASAPLLVPRMPDGTPFRCQVTWAGEGMFFASQLRGYHYAKRHPATGAPAPPITDLMAGRSRMWFHGVERTWLTLVSPLPPGIRWAFLLRAAFA